MNKTVTINLSGIVFHIDENAYELLRKYLETLRGHFAATQGRDEIIADIEGRMAEMFSEKIGDTKNVIMLADVQSVIDLMGRPEQVAGEDETTGERGSYSDTLRKRLFRNPDDKMVAGVCSGIGAYFDVDIIWIRLLFAALFFIGGGVLLYIILWIIMPVAKTPSEKLQMRGEPINISSIKKSVQEEMDDLKKRGQAFASNLATDENKHRVRSGAGRFADFLGEVIRAIFKVIVAIFAVFFIIISVAVLLAMTVAIFSGIGVLNFVVPHAVVGMVLTHTQMWLLLIGALLAIGIPFALLLLNGLKILFHVNINLKRTGAVMGGLWLIGLGICIITGIQIGSEFSKDATSKQSQIITLSSSANTIVLKTDSKWFNDEDHVYHFHDFDDLILTGKNRDSVLAPFVFVDVEQSENDSVFITESFYACGDNYDEAHRRASEINYHFSVTDSVITLPNYFVMNTNQEYRGQHIKVILKLPKGKSVKLDRSLSWMLDDVANVTDTYDGDMLGHSWKMTTDGLECRDCTDLDKENWKNKEWHSDDGDVSIDHGKVIIHKNGKTIEITRGDIRVDTI